jgi:hypothetical protein
MVKRLGKKNYPIMAGKKKFDAAPKHNPVKRRKSLKTKPSREHSVIKLKWF